MDNKEMFYSCMAMPESQLLGLINFEFKKALKLKLDIIDDWINNKKCKCAEHLDIQSKRFSLDCEHLNKEIREKMEEKDRKIKIKCSALNLKSLKYSKRFYQNQQNVQREEG